MSKNLVSGISYTKSVGSKFLNLYLISRKQYVYLEMYDGSGYSKTALSNITSDLMYISKPNF